MGHVMLYYHRPPKVGRNITLHSTHIATTRHIIYWLWLGNSQECVRSFTTRESRRFPVGFAKKNPKYRVYTLRDFRVLARDVLHAISVGFQCYNFATSSHPPRIILRRVIGGGTIFFIQFLHRISLCLAGLDIRSVLSVGPRTRAIVSDARNTPDATQ